MKIKLFSVCRFIIPEANPVNLFDIIYTRYDIHIYRLHGANIVYDHTWFNTEIASSVLSYSRYPL
jgi:hypothetical protein